MVGLGRQFFEDGARGEEEDGAAEEFEDGFGEEEGAEGGRGGGEGGHWKRLGGRWAEGIVCLFKKGKGKGTGRGLGELGELGREDEWSGWNSDTGLIKRCMTRGRSMDEMGAIERDCAIRT